MKIRQKEQVKTMRLDGCSYDQIAGLLKIPKSTIASFCQTNHLVPERNAHHHYQLCQYCGELFIPKTKREQFYCSNRCRNAAWHKRNEDAYLSAALRHELEELNKNPYNEPVIIGMKPINPEETLDFSGDLSDELGVSYHKKDKI